MYLCGNIFPIWSLCQLQNYMTHMKNKNTSKQVKYDIFQLLGKKWRMRLNFDYCINYLAWSSVGSQLWSSEASSRVGPVEFNCCHPTHCCPTRWQPAQQMPTQNNRWPKPRKGRSSCGAVRRVHRWSVRALSPSFFLIPAIRRLCFLSITDRESHFNVMTQA